MLDRDLAALYEVPTKVFNQAVRRNLERFPQDFMFQLSDDEAENLRSQIVTSSWGGAIIPSSSRSMELPCFQRFCVVNALYR
jgi:hypothetical protein